MTEKFDPWIRASSLAVLLRSHRCVDIDRRLRQGAALGEIQAKARLAKLRRLVSAEWEYDRYRDDEERDWPVPTSIWKGRHGARLNLSTDEYYSGFLGRSEDICEAALIGLSFDQQQALDFFGVEGAATIINAEVIPAAMQIEAKSVPSAATGPSALSAKAEWEIEGKRVAAQLDSEGIAKRDVRQHHINDRWSPDKGSPYAVSAITGLMEGKPRNGRPPKVSG